MKLELFINPTMNWSLIRRALIEPPMGRVSPHWNKIQVQLSQPKITISDNFLIYTEKEAFNSIYYRINF